MYHGDRVLNGQGRLFALHMFEAKQMCDVWATVHYADASWRVFDLKLKQLPPRVVCDPIVYFDRVSNICRSHGVSDVDWVMSIRRTTDRDVHELVNEVDFCSKPHAYAVLGNNAWMH
jgi:hypothetical protein